ncbi:hypothetical protein [Dyella humicola]|uniref:hypothetical protein n=1 Tax=Dyella humicola TaxID=2992126 RepID=UPI002258AE31|nr:hypothetical protein [Dyella humicola]
MKSYAIASVITSVFLLAGCGVGKPFVQPGINTNDSAHVVTDSDHSSQVAGWDQRIYIWAIDGKDTHAGVGLRPEEAYLSEGPHKLEIIYMFMGASAKGRLTLVAQRGHDYVIHRQQDNGRMRFWITDGWSGPVVGGIAD